MTGFDGVRAAASNIVEGTGGYTQEMFLTDFPQFTKTEGGGSLIPKAVLGLFIQDANQSIRPKRWFSKWRYACGLFVAHHATLYLRTWAEGSSSPAQAAATGATVGVVKSATLGDSSVSYDTAALTAGTEKWGSLNATQYGQLLASEARLVGMGGTLVI